MSLYEKAKCLYYSSSFDSLPEVYTNLSYRIVLSEKLLKYLASISSLFITSLFSKNLPFPICNQAELACWLLYPI